MKKEDIVVVIPIYKSTLSSREEQSLRQCVEVLADYPMQFIKPQSLDLSNILSRYPKLGVINFPDVCFDSLEDYNRLVLTDDFYNCFSQYVYMLIYQLDAYVFRDELLIWAEKGYDYIGAPWLPLEHPIKRKLRYKLKRWYYRLTDNSSQLRRWKYIEYEVGNGGFSLRRIDKMIQITSRYKNCIQQLLDAEQPFYPEDVLLYVEVRAPGFRLRRPSYEEAMSFALETGAAWAYEQMNRQLPFGCHAWYHPDYSSFWSSFIK